MSLHVAFPLLALLLNLCLMALALGQAAGRPVNRVFAVFAAALAAWNGGVFVLRRAPGAAEAMLAEVVIHVAIVAIPALYLHFVLRFVGGDDRAGRRWLVGAYAAAAVFGAATLSGTPWFLRGVRWTFWGWAPAPGPLYAAFLLTFNAVMLYGLGRLRRAHAAAPTGYQRNRLRLVLAGSIVTLAGGAIDFLRFALAAALPAAEQVYPVGIPANLVFALLLGTAILRYRLFDVGAVLRAVAAYGLVWAAAAAGLATLAGLLGWPVWRSAEATIAVAAVALGLTLMLGPPGRGLDRLLRRAMFADRRGGYERLLELSRRLSGVLDRQNIIGRVVAGVAEAIPAAHCALLTRTDGVLVLPPGGAAGLAPGAVPGLAADGPLASWLRASGPLVREEALADPARARRLAPELERLAPLRAAVLVPLETEERLTGILLVGEKLSGEVFTRRELELLALVASQAATALENARLYEAVRQAYDELSRTQAQLVQAQRMEAVGRLAGGVAHDFNNLLTVLKGRGEMLALHLGPAHPRYRDAALLVETSDRAARLTRQLLAFSRRQVLQPRSLDLTAVVDGLQKMLHRLIGEDVELAVTPAVPCRITADPGQVEQVLLNLALNARDAMPRGGRLTITVAEEDITAPTPVATGTILPGAYAVLEVTDTGEGISPEVLPRIFEPFFTTKPVGKGTGLGLATVYGIVTQSGGHLAVASAPGAGATFRAYFPRAAEGADAPAPERDPAAPRRGRGAVLVVEDDAAVRDLAREVLAGAGYAVLEAAEAEAALRLVAGHPGHVDLLLTDVVMPGLSGRELARRLEASRPGLRTLYMSGYTDDDILRHGVSRREVAFLPKPFAPDELLSRVGETLQAPAAPSLAAV
jgi:signal transduction histidine kinase/CheY-like chemotaxis protein